MLIAVNPYKCMDHLNTFDTIERYLGVSMDALPAHIFGIGEQLD